MENTKRISSNRKIASFILVLVFSLSIILQIMPSVKATFAGGSGTIGDPYQISNVTQLQEMQGFLSSYFILINNIDATITSTWNDGSGFIPINGFGGSFDGQNHTISNLYINNVTYSNTGFIGYNGGTIKNLGLINVNITGLDDTSGVVGYNNGHVTNCYSTGVVKGRDYIGGIGGDTLPFSVITNCYSRCKVISTNIDAGGLVGWNQGIITNCYATGNVLSSTHAGGLIGYEYQGTVTNCYSTGTVTAPTYAGGLIGVNYNWWGIITCCYWDIQTSGMESSQGGEGRTTAQMTYPYEGYDPPCAGLYQGWDLANYMGNTTSIWVHDDPQNGGYPLFRTDYVPHPSPTQDIIVTLAFYGPYWDINHDGNTNYLDVSSLVSHYGDTVTPRPPRYKGDDRWDITGDGAVDYLDISSLVTHYGERWLVP